MTALISTVHTTRLPYTGRIHSITLPTGGQITYTYSGGCGSGSGSGIETDGSGGILTRSTSNGTRTYGRAGSLERTTTTVSDEKNNQTVYSFVVDSTLDNIYETERQVYQGSISGTPLQEIDTCYNGVSSNCNSQSITLPITEQDATVQYNGKGAVTTKNTMDASGDLTQSNIYSGSTLLLSTVNTYLTPGAVTEFTGTTTRDGSGNFVSGIGYGYDETSPTATSGVPQHGTPLSNPGNQTSQQVIVGGGSGLLNTTTAYYDTGMPLSVQDPGGFTTTYGYDSSNTFQTSVTLPTPSSGVALSTSASYDTASGVLLSSTGMNQGQTFSATRYDALLRPNTMTTPENGQSTASYTPNQISAKTQMNGSQWADTEQFLDGYGRVSRIAVQSSSGWYLTDSCYDATGLLQYQSMPYLSSVENPSSSSCSASNATQYSYDALGRVTQTASPDGDTIMKTYTGRAIQVADNNGTTRIIQHDTLGRISAVCEVVSYTSMPGGDSSQPCGSSFDIAGSGLLTQYTYNLASHTTQIAQGAQSRTFLADAAGRAVSMSEPESGTTSYSYAYNSTGLQVVRTRPAANQLTTASLVYTNTTTQYDSLGRVVSVLYTNAANGSQDQYTPNRYFYYDQSGNGGSIPNMGSSKGQLTEMGNGIHGRSYAYDIMGRVTETVECLPGYCGTRPDIYRWYGYDLASELTTEQYATQGGGAAPATLSYNYNVAGQLASMTGGQNNGFPNSSLLSADQPSMQPGGPQLVDYGNHLANYYTFDAMDRVNGQWLCGSPGGYNCMYQMNGQTYTENYYYGNVQQQVGRQTKWVVDTVLQRWTQFSYDQMGNLAGSSSMPNSGYAALNFSASYDRYGNRWSESVSGTPSGTGPNQTVTFNTANNQISGYTYDQAGNITGDSTGAHTYTYDAEHNLIQVDGGSTAAYAFDALNERVSANAGGLSNVYGIDLQGRRSTIWTNGATAVSQVEYYAGGQDLAYWSNSDNNIHFQHKDLIGTERMRTTANGSQEGTYVTLPFGEPNSSSGVDLNPDHFAGLEQDVNSTLELHHAAMREYSAIQGRWMSPDPYSGSYVAADPQSYNRYAYVENNVLSLIDPSGLNEGCEGEQIEVGTARAAFMLPPCTVQPPNPPSPPPAAPGGSSPSGGSNAPNQIGCKTKLPNGQTVGAVVQQQRAMLQQAFNEAAAQAPTGDGSDPLAFELGAFAAIVRPNGPIDFKKGQSGTTFVQMGLAGNFAYYAIGAGYFGPNILDAGAGLYGLTAATFFPRSTVHFSDLTGHYLSDSAANQMKGPGLAANGCSGT